MFSGLTGLAGHFVTRPSERGKQTHMVEDVWARVLGFCDWQTHLRVAVCSKELRTWARVDGVWEKPVIFSNPLQVWQACRRLALSHVVFEFRVNIQLICFLWHSLRGHLRELHLRHVVTNPHILFEVGSWDFLTRLVLSHVDLGFLTRDWNKLGDRASVTVITPNQNPILVVILDMSE